MCTRANTHTHARAHTHTHTHTYIHTHTHTHTCVCVYILYTFSVYNFLFLITGWMPSTFISSRKGKSEAVSHKPEDFMDSEVSVILV